MITRGLQLRVVQAASCLAASLPCAAQDQERARTEDRAEQSQDTREHPSQHDRQQEARELVSGLDLLDGPLDINWTALRDGLAEVGIETGLYWTLDTSWLAAGGLEPGATAARNLLEYEVAADTGTFGLEGGTLFLSFQGIHGVDGSAQAGVLQPLSSLDAEERLQLGRIWYEHSFTQAWVRGGKMDANSMFAFSESASSFMHSSMGFSPNILGLPTYPDPAFGLAVGGHWTRALGLRLGVFDGAAETGIPTGSRGPSTLFGEPDDMFLIAELHFEWGDARVGHLSLGGWQHTGEFARFDSGTESGTQGAYLVLDQRLRPESQAGTRALDMFLQLGLADPDVALIETHVGAGLVLDRPFSASLADKLGLGASLALLSEQSGFGVGADEELALEAFYGIDPLPWVRLQPTLQYVLNPGGDATLDDAFVLALRTSLSL